MPQQNESAFAAKKFGDVHGHAMAHIDEGDGAPLILQRGNPASSYL